MSQDSNQTRLSRALCSLEGLSVGDAFGEQYFMDWDTIRHILTSDERPAAPYNFTDEEFMAQRIQARKMPFKKTWRWTDDTAMALSIVENLRDFGEIKPEALAQSFSRRFADEPDRGYGPAMHGLLPQLSSGDYSAASQLFDGQGSYGNGAAMRVAPIGAYFADDLDAVVENARRSAEVTHVNQEAVVGAIAIALATAYAWRLRDKNEEFDGKRFIRDIRDFLPESQVREGVTYARGMLEDSDIEEAVAVLGNGENITAFDTVPFCLWCAAQHLNNFEEAIWLTLSGLGDRDTTCAIVGGIVATHTGTEGIPNLWRDSREALPLS
jgi:ADP-ribosylglycohydrolase